MKQTEASDADVCVEQDHGLLQLQVGSRIVQPITSHGLGSSRQLCQLPCGCFHVVMLKHTIQHNKGVLE